MWHVQPPSCLTTIDLILSTRWLRAPSDDFSSAGKVKRKTAPWGWFGAADNCPPWASAIERLIANPMPIPSGLVV
jgi:hypothetical protein